MGDMSTLNVVEPIDLIKQSVGHVVLLKCRGNRELKGKLHVKGHLELAKSTGRPSIHISI